MSASKAKGTQGSATGQCQICDEPFDWVDGRTARKITCSAECLMVLRRQRYASNPRPRKIRPGLAERLWSRVVTMPDGCMEWQGYRDPKGYGQIGVGGQGNGNILTHRAAWKVTHGEDPGDMFVCHRCDNPPCCNPEHLFLGTVQDNVADAVTKGRVRGPRAYENANTRLTTNEVAEIRGLVASGETQASVARNFGVTPQYVGQLVNGKWRRHG